MAPHLDELELDQVMKWKGKKGTTEMHTLLAQQRLERGIEPAGCDAIRKALRGATHRRGRSETRGHKRRVTQRGIEALDRARKRVIEKAEGKREAPWKRIIKTARVRKVEATCFYGVRAVPVRSPYGPRTVPVRSPYGTRWKNT